MKVLLEKAKTEITVKKSRFIAEAFPVHSQNEARDQIKKLKELYKDATHVVHSFVVGNSQEICGMSDDGEPSGTAGRPVLDILKGSGITNILITVTRYFGGTLLGTGGLVKAYGDSCKAVLSLCRTEELISKIKFKFLTEYSLYETIKHNFNDFHISNIQENFLSSVEISGEIYEEEIERFKVFLQNISSGKIELICI